MGIPGDVIVYDQSQINYFDGMDCKPDTCSSERSFLDLYDDQLDYFSDEYTNFGEEPHDIDELSTLELLMYEQQELHSMRILNQGKQDMYSENSCTFLEKQILNQQLLDQSLNEYWGTRDARWVNQQTKKEKFFYSQPQEKDRWGQRFSFEQFSEQASSIKSQTQSDSSKTSQPEEPLHKSRHCRHFLKGYCKLGDSCQFRHDQSIFCTDLQKVFLAGLPTNFTSSLLRMKLTEQGYTVLNNPKIVKWFSPQVCLGSVEEAQRLVKKGTIVIDETVVRVRQFKAFAGDKKQKWPDEIERSIFLGGLSSDTTAKTIIDELRKMGFIVVNIPVLKSGYSPQVVLITYHQAQTLIKLKRVQINGSIVNVRPYANMRSFSKKKKRTKLPAI